MRPSSEEIGLAPYEFARLMSYAVLHDAIATGGLWSIASGLARNELPAVKQKFRILTQPTHVTYNATHTSEQMLMIFSFCRS